jgi:hypothetical protein
MLTDMTELINVRSGKPLLAGVWESMLLTTAMTIQFLVIVKRPCRDRETYFYAIQCCCYKQISVDHDHHVLFVVR